MNGFMLELLRAKQFRQFSTKKQLLTKLKISTMEEKVLATLKSKGEPMKAGEIAEAAAMPKADVDKAIKTLVKEGKVNSPKRCYYGMV